MSLRMRLCALSGQVRRAGLEGYSRCAKSPEKRQLRGVHTLDIARHDLLCAVAGETNGELAVGAAARALLDLAHAEDAVANQRAVREHRVVVALVDDCVHALVGR